MHIGSENGKKDSSKPSNKIHYWWGILPYVTIPKTSHTAHLQDPMRSTGVNSSGIKL